MLLYDGFSNLPAITLNQNQFMNKQSALTLAACAAATLMASTAHASVTQLTNASQISASYVNNFETVKDSGPATFGNGQLYSAASAASGVTSSGTSGLLSLDFPQALEVSLSSSYNAVGMYFGNDDVCCSTGYAATLEVFSGATSLGSVSLTANMNDYADQFIGLSSTLSFDKVVISYGGASLYTYIDDFQVGVAAVPEPETYAMLLAGLGVMGAVARRRKARQV